MVPQQSKAGRRKMRFTIFGVIVMLISMAHAGELWLPGIFSEGMVLQRNQTVPIWGKAAAGANIAVMIYDGGKKLAGGTATAAADTGRWRINLDPLPTGGRYTLMIESKGPGKTAEERIVFTNVLVGEVWLICGQSNMMFPMNACAERDDAVEHRSEYPLIRVVQIGSRNSHEILTPQTENSGYWGAIKWEDASYLLPRSSSTDIPGSCSAVGYFFARDLSKWLGGNVPVAMVEIGAILPVESWVSDDVVAGIPEIAALRGKGYPSSTGRAYNANIAPLAPFAAAGVIYYQGEMNAGRQNDYYFGLKGLIKSWRAAWDKPNMPFLIVQLPGFIEHQAGKTALDMDAASLAKFNKMNENHSYCGIREAQLRISREVPSTGIAVIIDKGEKFDIHPPRKKVVGERLALQARKIAYNDKTAIADSPAPVEFHRDGKQYIITFTGIDGGLTVKGTVTGFELRNADGIWHPAEVKIKADTVTVQNKDITEPTGVRYAWAGFPDISLFNKAGLPATPFCYPPIDLAKWQAGEK
jgi:sialate O-acetylesterase